MLSQWCADNNKTTTTVGKFEVCVGLPMMVYGANQAKLGMFKTHIWKVTDIDNKTITVSNGDLSHTMTHPQFCRTFDYQFATTTHKYQGNSIAGQYDIWQVENMDRELLYTALTRAHKFADVFIRGKPLAEYRTNTRNSSVFIPTKPVQHTVGRIYEIATEDGGHYIGQTVHSIDTRLAQHLEESTTERMAASLNSKATIRLVKEVLFLEQRELDQLEKRYIVECCDEYGEMCMNGTHHTTVAAPKKVIASMRKEKFAPFFDNKKELWVVECKAAGIDPADKRTTFSCKKLGDAAEALAVIRGQELRAKYFGVAAHPERQSVLATLN